MFFVAALIPLLVGAAYYSKALFGKSWMQVNGFREEDLEGGNMALIMGLAYFFSLVFSFFMSGLVIHQGHVFQMMIPQALESGSAAQQQFNDLMAQYGDQHRNFGHGALHGGLFGVFLALPMIAINALFERRGWKYILIHTGYWVITSLLVGGLLCATLEYAPIT